MHVVIEIISGSMTGTRARLMADQNLTVGRTEWSDFVVPDSHISSQHFSLAVDQESCRLTDLKSANGTYVNGKRVNETVLQDGDLVVAGQTNFVVRFNAPIRGDTGNFARAASLQTLNSIRPEPPPPRSEIFVQTLPSGIHHAQCPVADLPPRELVDRIEREGSVYLIVDFNRLQVPIPAELGDSGISVRLVAGSGPPQLSAAGRPAGLARGTCPCRLGVG